MNELTAEYQVNGLTYKSNNQSVVTRDDAGNVQIDNTISDLLIIEPVTEFITLDSALRVIDTQFNYYSFPVTTIQSQETSSFEFNETLDLLVADEEDIIYAMYQPEGTINIATASDRSGIDMSRVLKGSTQLYKNKYYITDDIKNSGKNLRIRFKITHKNTGSSTGTCYWFINKEGFGGLERGWKGAFTSLTSDNASTPGVINAGNTKSTFADITILNSEISAGDKLNIAVSTGQSGHQILGESSYWSITDASKNVDIWNNKIVQ